MEITKYQPIPLNRKNIASPWSPILMMFAFIPYTWGGGGKKKEIYEAKKKAQINSVGWQHKRVDNNKTNKAQASRFCSTASHHSSVQNGNIFIFPA